MVRTMRIDSESGEPAIVRFESMTDSGCVSRNASVAGEIDVPGFVGKKISR